SVVLPLGRAARSRCLSSFPTRRSSDLRYLTVAGHCDVMSSKEVYLWRDGNKLRASSVSSILKMLNCTEMRMRSMTNEAFDETTEQHYSPGLGLWMDEWENNPLVWQHPMAETPYG